MNHIDKSEFVLKFMSQSDIMVNTPLFTTCGEPVHVLYKGLNLGFDLATEIRATAGDL